MVENSRISDPNANMYAITQRELAERTDSILPRADAIAQMSLTDREKQLRMLRQARDGAVVGGTIVHNEVQIEQPELPFQDIKG